MSGRHGGSGFWRGFAAGLVLAALLALALAWLIPPSGTPDAASGVTSPATEAPPAPASLVPDSSAAPKIDGSAGPGSPSLVPQADH